jgi:hypothetical protein
MRKKQKGMSNFTWGLIALTVAVVVTYLGFTKSIPFQHHFTIKAAFKSAVNIRTNAPVRIAGVNIGKVTDVEPEGKGTNQGALVSMQVSDNGLPIHTDARAAIRPRSLPRGQLLRRYPAGNAEHAQARRRRRRHDPDPADAHAGPARPDPGRAAGRHPEQLERPPAGVLARPAAAGVDGLQRLDPLLGARIQEHGDRQPGLPGREARRPERLHARLRHGGAGARPTLPSCRA